MPSSQGTSHEHVITVDLNWYTWRPT